MDVDFPGSDLEYIQTCLSEHSLDSPELVSELPETKGMQAFLPSVSPAWMPLGTILSVPVSVTLGQAHSGLYGRYLLGQVGNAFYELLNSDH